MLISPDSPLTIEFDRPIRTKIQATITPDIPGTWTYSSTKFLIFKDQLIFYPDQSLQPDAEYTITLTHIKSPVNPFTSPDQLLFIINTPPSPQVTKISPLVNQTAFRRDGSVTINLDIPTDSSLEWSAQFDPPIQTSTHFSDDFLSVSFNPISPLPHSTKYHVDITKTIVTYDYQTDSVVDRLDSIITASTSFTTVDSVDLRSIKPTTQPILPQDDITLIFKQPMNTRSVEQSLHLNPPINFHISWPGNQKMILNPDSSWDLGQTYTLTIKDTAESIDGGSLTEPVSYKFTIIDQIALTTSAIAQAIHVDQPINLSFDQPVDTSSVQSHFQISPAADGSFLWNNNQLTFTPTSLLDYQTNYQISLSSGITSLFGTPNQQTLDFNFTTLPQSHQLAVPLYKQSRSFTCFAATARMVLAYRGINHLSEMEIWNQLPKETTPRNFTTNTWGDPNRGIVGSSTGGGEGGYGAHWDPVAEFLRQYRQVDVKRQWNLTDALKEVAQGNPVMVWWVNGVWPAKDVSWHLFDGSKVYTVNGMHVEIIKGFVGTPSHPITIITNDPWRGERRYSPQSFENLWRWFDYTALVIY
jgi:uncharacterized protein YvpB